MQNNTNESKAIGKYLRLSTIKASRILNEIRGKNYSQAILILQYAPYRACISIKKILESAAANAETKYGINKNKLKIKEAFVNKGPIMKRFQPRAQGRAYPIHKPTCHITLSVITIDSQTN
uniref:Large ribosomal subunit protein uL22c n=1 Tax=Kumanoa americana TaxID=1196377 RepID=A0A1C9CGY8_9FLOR|nr:ribosomal protein L22 [Kumanoa americana]AOM67627.1 ribosomal protein L22 [Kumanoa americana]